MKIEVISKSQKQTKKLGEKLAKKIISGKIKKRILALSGDFGSGKTTFVQGFAKGLQVKSKILSPSFIVMRRFELYLENFKNFYHIDCYRIKEEKEILALGFKKIASNPENLVVIEWAEKIKKIIPKKNSLWIKFSICNLKERKISIENIKQNLLISK